MGQVQITNTCVLFQCVERPRIRDRDRCQNLNLNFVAAALFRCARLCFVVSFRKETENRCLCEMWYIYWKKVQFL